MIKSNSLSIGAVLLKIMQFSLALVPFGFTYFMISNYSLPLYQEKKTVLLCATAVIAMIVLIAAAMPKKISRKQRICICIALFCAGLPIRIIVSDLLQTAPFSDFATCYNYAMLKAEEWEKIYITDYPYLGAYALFLRVFFKFVPGSVFSAQLANALATSCIPVFLFLGTEKMTSKTSIALISGLIYCFYPGLIVYNSITSCEHISQVFLSAGFYAIAYEKTIPSQQNKKKNIVYFIAALMFGLMCLFKPLFVIIAPAFLMADFCYDVLPLIIKSVKEHLIDSRLLRTVLRNILFVLVIFMVFKTSVMAVQIKIVGKTTKTSNPISTTIYRGLSPKARGNWDPDVISTCNEIMREYKSNREINKVLFQKLMDEYHGDVNLLTDVITDKMRTDFCNEGVYWYWTFNSEANNILQNNWIGEIYFSLFPNAFFMLMCGIMSIGLIIRTIRKCHGKEIEFFVSGVVYLFVIVLILMEAQGRYKSNIMPYICILFALATESIVELLRIVKIWLTKLYVYIFAVIHPRKE